MHQHRQRNPFEFLPGDNKHTLRADMEFEMKCNLLKRCRIKSGNTLSQMQVRISAAGDVHQSKRRMYTVD